MSECKQHPFEQFRAEREAGNAAALDTNSLMIKRFFSLDKQCYGEGALPESTKELLGLVASMVLRCNDCIDYHLQRCVELDFSQDQIDEAMGVALMVGGSIVIPHLRHAKQSLKFLFEEQQNLQV